MFRVSMYNLVVAFFSTLVKRCIPLEPLETPEVHQKLDIIKNGKNKVA
jgi:hypothetical protein